MVIISFVRLVMIVNSYDRCFFLRWLLIMIFVFSSEFKKFYRGLCLFECGGFLEKFDGFNVRIIDLKEINI